MTVPGAPGVGREPPSDGICWAGAEPGALGAGASGWAALVQFSINDILPLARYFWLCTIHLAWGTSLPTEPPKTVEMPWACRIATAL